MGWWTRKTQQQDAPPQAAWDPFDAIPVVAEDVETHADSKGQLHICRTEPDARGLAAAIRRRLGMRRQVRVQLDVDGAAFWNQIDGGQSLRQIEESIRQRTGASQEMTEKATVLFTRMLMARRLIYLRMPGDCEE